MGTISRSSFRKHGLPLRTICLLFLCSMAVEPGFAKQAWPDSPLPIEAQSSLERAGKLMKSGKYEKAKPLIMSVLEAQNDVPKCIAVAQFTEAHAFPMMDTRRACLNRALELCQTTDDLLLVALRSRKYQFFEITKQAISKLVASAKTMPQLYDLARKSQEVALNDVAHLAMDKAFTGIKTQEEAFGYADMCKALGLDDLLRKTVKQLVDDEDTTSGLCDLCLSIEKYGMRDLNRYGMRKALDLCKTVPDMQYIKDVARRLNEPDVLARADFFVRKGKLIQKIKDDQAAHDSKVRAWQASQDLEAARARDAAREAAKAAEATNAAGFGKSNPDAAKSAPTGSERPSTGY